MPDLILIGGGEHARVVAEAASANGLVIRGCIARDAPVGFTWLGDDDALNHIDWNTAGAILGVGRISVRQRLAAAPVRAWTTVVHPRAWVSPSALLGQGVFVGAGSVINANARISDHAIINSGAIVEHDVVVGALSHVAPGAVIGGGTVIGTGVFIGLGARLRDHIRLGNGCTVAMGAVVIRDVDAHLTVKGHPAS